MIYVEISQCQSGFGWGLDPQPNVWMVLLSKSLGKRPLAAQWLHMLSGTSTGNPRGVPTSFAGGVGQLRPSDSLWDVRITFLILKAFIVHGTLTAAARISCCSSSWYLCQGLKWKVLA